VVWVAFVNMIAIGCMEYVVGAVAKTRALQLRAAGGAIVSAMARVSRLMDVIAGGAAADAYVALAIGAARMALAFRA
jgi:hypothetical protein